MKLFEFEKYFPDEESCRAKFMDIRQKQGIVCPKCGCKLHYWKTSKQMYQCTKCGWQAKPEITYGDVRFQTAISVPVYRNAPPDCNKTFILCI